MVRSLETTPERRMAQLLLNKGAPRIKNTQGERPRPLVVRSPATTALESFAGLPGRESGPPRSLLCRVFIAARELPTPGLGARLLRQRTEEATRVAAREWRLESVHRV
jgi:hypothetical protein